MRYNNYNLLNTYHILDYAHAHDDSNIVWSYKVHTIGIHQFLNSWKWQSHIPERLNIHSDVVDVDYLLFDMVSELR